MDRVLCSKCEADDVICYTTEETAVCPNCCEDHEYEYERYDRGHFCQHCGAEAPPDWYSSDDDVGFWSPPSGEPLGIPANEMDGNASVANTSRENRRKWDNWVSFCNSWGHSSPLPRFAMPKTNQIPFLSPSRRTPGATYHWKPSAASCAASGWTNLKLGTDWNVAVAGAIAQNDRVAQWLRTLRAASTVRKRTGAEDPPLARPRRCLQGQRRLGRLKPKTRREYESQLRPLDHWALDGDLRLTDLDRPLVVELRDLLVRDPRKHRTAAMLRVLRILCNFGSNKGWLPLGLASSINIPEPPKRRHRLIIIAICPSCSTPPTRSSCRTSGSAACSASSPCSARAICWRRPRSASAHRRRRYFGRGAARARRRRRPRARPVPRAGENQGAGRHPAAAARPRRGRGGDRRSRTAGQHADPPDRQVGPPLPRKDLPARFRARAGQGGKPRQMALEAHRSAVRASTTATHGLSARKRLQALVAALTGCQFRDLRRSGMCWLRELGVPVAMIASISGHSIEETQKILDTYMPRDTRSAAEGMAIALTRQAARDAADELEREAL
jgi:hypothetical protein